MGGEKKFIFLPEVRESYDNEAKIKPKDHIYNSNDGSNDGLSYPNTLEINAHCHIDEVNISALAACVKLWHKTNISKLFCQNYNENGWIYFCDLSPTLPRKQAGGRADNN